MTQNIKHETSVQALELRERVLYQVTAIDGKARHFAFICRCGPDEARAMTWGVLLALLSDSGILAEIRQIELLTTTFEADLYQEGETTPDVEEVGQL